VHVEEELSTDVIRCEFAEMNFVEARIIWAKSPTAQTLARQALHYTGGMIDLVEPQCSGDEDDKSHDSKVLGPQGA
jgi:hypothetical protein